MAADDVSGTRAQDARFRAAVSGARRTRVELGPDAVRRHLAGSGGILGADADALGRRAARASPTYGLVPDAVTPPRRRPTRVGGLRPVMALLARPVRVAGPAGRARRQLRADVRDPRPSRIATLPVGYGDGWRRALSDRASALVRGVARPARRQGRDGRRHGRRHGRARRRR